MHSKWNSKPLPHELWLKNHRELNCLHLSTLHPQAVPMHPGAGAEITLQHRSILPKKVTDYSRGGWQWQQNVWSNKWEVSTPSQKRGENWDWVALECNSRNRGSDQITEFHLTLQQMTWEYRDLPMEEEHWRLSKDQVEPKVCRLGTAHYL